jgi:hypothetical protein
VAVSDSQNSNKILDSFECVEAFISDKDAFDNALTSVSNSNLTFSKIEFEDNWDQNKDGFYSIDNHEEKVDL